MANLPMEEIEKMVGSRYALTVLAGKRARELRDGAPRLVNSDAKNPIIVALQEIYEGKIVPEGLDETAAAPPAVEAAGTGVVDVSDATDDAPAALPAPEAAAAEADDAPATELSEAAADAVAEGTEDEASPEG